MQATIRFEWLFSTPMPIWQQRPRLFNQDVLQPVARILENRPFTLISSLGLWEGKQELAWVLVEYRDHVGFADEFDEYAEHIGQRLAAEFRQDCVLASWQYVNAGLVTP